MSTPGWSSAGPAPPLGRALALYTGLRALAFVGSYGVMLVLGVQRFAAIFGALLVSSVVALAFLRPQRDAVAQALAARADAKRAERERLRSILDEQ